MLVLSPTNADASKEKGGPKRSAVGPASTSGIEIIFPLLTEVVAVHVRLPEIQVWEPSFEEAFARLRGALGSCLGGLQKRPS